LLSIEQSVEKLERKFKKVGISDLKSDVARKAERADLE